MKRRKHTAGTTIRVPLGVHGPTWPPLATSSHQAIHGDFNQNLTASAGAIDGTSLEASATGRPMTGIEHPADGTWSPLLSNETAEHRIRADERERCARLAEQEAAQYRNADVGSGALVAFADRLRQAITREGP